MTMYEQSQQSDWLQTELESCHHRRFCQDISVSGNQAGIQDGTRSGLWSECARLLAQQLRTSQTCLTRTGAWFKRVLWDISQIGYDAEWHCIPASELGAHHHRDRIWILAYPSRTWEARSGRTGHPKAALRRRYSGLPNASQGGTTGNWKPVRDSGHTVQLSLPICQKLTDTAGQAYCGKPDVGRDGSSGVVLRHREMLRQRSSAANTRVNRRAINEANL